MSKISLKHSGGNVVSLNSPTNAPGAADVAFKLPNADGSAGQFMKTDGSGNLSFDAAGGGKFASYAIICDQKSSGTSGGTFTSGGWYTRDLNTEIADADGIVSISSNKFTLQAGTYLIKASAPAYRSQDHQITLYRTSGTQAHIAFGTSAYTNTTAMTRSSLDVRVTLSTATDFEIRHRCSNTISGNGFGESVGFPDGSVETYSIVEIYKES